MCVLFLMVVVVIVMLVIVLYCMFNDDDSDDFLMLVGIGRLVLGVEVGNLLMMFIRFIFFFRFMVGGGG